MKSITYKYIFVIALIISVYSYITYNIYDIMVVNHEYYKNKLDEVTINTLSGESTPRGRIYDRNYNLLVDNVGVKTIYYKRVKNKTSQDIINSIRLLSENIELDIDNVSDNMIINYYRYINKDIYDNKITSEEKDKYKKRLLTKEEIENIKVSRITDKEKEDINKKEAYIYYLMNKGYYYDETVIKKDVSEKEYAFVASNIDKLNGFNVKLEWERKYLYGDTFRVILGDISSIPSELKDYYLNKGYKLDDRVGVSYLEYQYEDILKGEKALYKLNDDNSYSLIKEGKRGNDIVLTIDINIQREVERILEEEVLNAKINDYNTSLYDGSDVIVTEPNTGEILAFSSRFLLYKDDGYTLYDNSPSLLTNPVSPGSIVKGASISTGYKYNAIDIGTTFLDECIKFMNTPRKCSWSSSLGYVNDVNSLAVSSNSYQFKTALKVANSTYFYNGPITIDESAFDKYRNMFKEYGLGVKTNIDLPIESNGETGTKRDPGLLLDLTIGQYDTYTPIQLASYISTIASNGNRYQLHFLKEVHDSSSSEEIGTLKYKIEPKLVHKVDLEDKYINRIKEGFKRVMYNTGYGMMGDVYDSAGKTGTSETFKDTDNDGYIDKETISKGFVGYAPSENPKFSLVVLSPNVHYSDYSDYISPVNSKISSRVANKVFEILK